jgi:predicted nucleotidyltransferase
VNSPPLPDNKKLMETTLQGLLEPLIQQYDGPGVGSFVIMGSHARGDAGPHSDVDFVVFVDESLPEVEAVTHLVDDRLIVASRVTPSQVERWFTEPEAAAATIAGVRSARPLVDRERYFAAIQARANAFTWDGEMQAKADQWAGSMMVGLIEEVHKGLEGLRRQHVGRLLNARFGLSWLLSKTVQVQRGILIAGDNAFYDEVAEEIGVDSRWSRLRRSAFGIEEQEGRGHTLRAQVEAGLWLYVETAELLKDSLPAQNAHLITQTVERIRQTLLRAEPDV